MSKRMGNGKEKRDPLDILLSRRSLPRHSPNEGGGISPLDVLELPSDLRNAMNRVMRRGEATPVQVAQEMEIDVATALSLLDVLVARGHLKQIGKEEQRIYKPILGQSRRPRLSSKLWEMLEE